MVFCEARYFIFLFPVTLIFVCISTASAAKAKSFSLDVGPKTIIPNTKSVTNLGDITDVNTNNIPLDAFRTAREGSSFEVSLPLDEGTYDLDLGFVETESCSSSGRVFHIYLDDEIMKESFNIFEAAKGCGRTYVASIPNLSISYIRLKPIVVKFVSVSGLATVSYIRAQPSKKQCVPVTRNATIQEPHLTHSIPGEYKPVVDQDGDKFEFVTLDGRGSHTHFSYNDISGRIIAYEWSIVETGEVISTKSIFKHKFPLGTTLVRLTVTDDICSQHRDDASITVTTTSLKGQYCYYYQFNNLTESLGPQTLLDSPSPTSSSPSFWGSLRFPPFPIFKNKFVARCIFSVQFDDASTFTKFSVDTAGSGSARVFKGSDTVLDTSTSSTSLGEKVPKGVQAFEVIYTRTNVEKPPTLDFKVNGKYPSKMFYDRSNVLPIITWVDPSSGSLGGGTNVRIHGFGLHLPLKVWFGKKAVFANKVGSLEWHASVTAPSAVAAGKVSIQVESAEGIRSNTVPYEYGGTCDDVSFDRARMGNLAIQQPTAVVLGNDNRLYIGTRPGIILVVTYDPVSLDATSKCSSEKFTDPRFKDKNGGLSPRSILGITLDPRDKVPRPYVTVNTLFWGKKSDNMDPKNRRAWSNGAVERFKPASSQTRQRNPNQCLEHDQNIVRNLPVSANDHGVNELIFDQHGDLLIAVGGNTNMGLPGTSFNSLWESYFSGSVVIAHLSRGGKFNGEIPYTSDVLHTARPKPGYTDVELYATGFRNMFSMFMARNGKIYGVDMGPNQGFGYTATSCSQFNGADGKSYMPDRILIDPSAQGEGRYGPNRGDKLVEVKPGRFYGHPNLQRALMTKEKGECAWIDPITGKRPGGGGAPSNYEHRLSYFTSAAIGIEEYGSTHFCGKLRGDLILPKYKRGGSLRVRMEGGKVLGIPPHKLVDQSGIRVIENVRGDLLFPQYLTTLGIFVYRPRVKSRSVLSVTNALPYRHGRKGGTLLTIGGSGFNENARISVDEENCPVTRVSTDSTEIECIVPPMTAGTLASVTVAVQNQKSTLDSAILYMMV